MNYDKWKKRLRTTSLKLESTNKAAAKRWRTFLGISPADFRASLKDLKALKLLPQERDAFVGRRLGVKFLNVIETQRNGRNWYDSVLRQTLRRGVPPRDAGRVAWNIYERQVKQWYRNHGWVTPWGSIDPWKMYHDLEDPRLPDTPQPPKPGKSRSAGKMKDMRENSKKRRGRKK